MVRALNQLLGVLVSLALGFLIFEGALRFLGWVPTPRIHRFDPVVGWVKLADTEMHRQTSEFDVRVRTNSRGLRGPETWSYDRVAETLRILMVGDSFTLGYTVAETESIPALLAESLAERGIAAEVLNGGTEGWSTDQEVLWLATEGARYRPDLVILQMYENDIFWNSQERYLQYPKPRVPDQGQGLWLPGQDSARTELVDPGQEPWIVRHTAVGSLIGRLGSGPQMPMLRDGSGIPAEWGVRLLGNQVGRGETRAALRAFGALARDMEAEALVLIIPDKAQVDAEAEQKMRGFMASEDYVPGRPYDFLVTAARESGLRVVGGLAPLQEARRAGRVYFSQDWHTNAAGNQALASAVAERLSGRDFPAVASLGATGAPVGDVAAVPEGDRGYGSSWILAGVIWLILGSLFRRRFPEQGWKGSYGPVGALLLGVFAVYAFGGWLVGLLPGTWQGIVPPVLLAAFLGLAGYYLRGRVAVMAELFFAFVRRGHWYMLPVIVALLSVGGLLVVAASSPWLAPFIYTLF